MMTELILYQFDECPYCAKVRFVLDKKKMEYKIVTMSYSRDDFVRKELFEKSGVHTVPVIKIVDKYIGDSNLIIEYLEKNF